jgi:FPC/CPF motif-containing protein YcgG
MFEVIILKKSLRTLYNLSVIVNDINNPKPIFNMANIMLYYGKIDYDVPGDCKYTLLFCCFAPDPEKVIKRIKSVTNCEAKYLEHLEIIEATEVVDQIPKWFVDYNKERYNGEGVFKDYKPFKNI